MIETIISNNCVGGAVCHELGMEFKTPTINLQIMPEEFTHFCIALPYYMKQELVEYKFISDRHKWYLTRMFGGVPNMPFGLVDDIMVCFQHYDTFDEAKKKWDERKAKIDYDNVGFIFHARDDGYEKEARRFLDANLPNKLVLAENFYIPGAVSFYPPEGENGFSAKNGKLRIVQVCDYKFWRANGWLK